jgi:hypothetical protein
MTQRGQDALAGWLDVPAKFLTRIDAPLKQHLVDGLLKRHQEKAHIRYTDTGILDVRDPAVDVVEPTDLVDVAAKVMGENSLVASNYRSAREFSFNTVVPFDPETGGDRVFGDKATQRRVGDLTAAGLTFNKDTQRNLAPTVQPWSYRLACTNGMTFLDPGIKFDARGTSVDEVLEELERLAERAFSQVEARVNAFYSLREERVDNPERTLVRIGREQGLPSRVVNHLVESAPMLGDNPSMFDLLNLVTHLANEPSLESRQGTVRSLQLAGGAVVVDHAERCPTCKTALNN